MKSHVMPRATSGIVAVRADAGKPTDIKAAIADVQASFEQFKTANDERIAALQKGQEDILNDIKVDAINADISKLQDLVDKMSKDQARAKLSGAGGNDEAQAARRFQALTQRKPVAEVLEVDVEGYQAYKAAFSQLCRANGQVDSLNADVRAALSVGSDRDGGYYVPAEQSMELEKRIYDTSPMRSVASVATISSGSWKAPYQSSKASHGGWVGERQARTSTGTPTVGMQTIEVHEHYAYPEATRTMLEDAALDVEDWLNEEVGDEFTRQENTAFVNGDGVMKPKGFVCSDYTDAAVTTDDATRDWGKLQYVASGSATGFPDQAGISGAANAGPLVDIISKLHPNYRPGANFAMNRATEAHLRKLTDGNGRYLVEIAAGIEGRFGFSIHGFEITNFEDMDDIGSDAFALAFGNFRRGYKIIDRRGISVIRDELTNKPYVGFYTTKRVGGDIRNFDAIKLMKFATS